jgi:hypothetical protein
MDLITWVIQIHNFVNVALGKQPLAVEQVLAIYSQLDPVSPFVKVDLQQIEEEKLTRYYGRLYVFAGLFICLAIGLYYIKRRWFFYLFS